MSSSKRLARDLHLIGPRAVQPKFVQRASNTSASVAD
jgi:hypothetical protein